MLGEPILEKILGDLPDGKVVEAHIGLHWTAVVVEQGAGLQRVQRCGLGATLSAEHEHRSQPDVPLAGSLERLSARELAALALEDQPPLSSLGIATVNALLQPPPTPWDSENAESILARRGAGKNVALVGHFSFVPRLIERVGRLWVLEQNPGPGDLPAERAAEIIPQADVVGITGMTVVNHTLAGLLQLARPDAFVIVFGPSTPLSPALFEFGVDCISGCQVTDVQAVIKTVAQGGNFRQLHQAGVKLVNMVSSI